MLTLCYVILVSLVTENIKVGKKRFIAGAICPKCKAMDRLTVQKIDDSEVRECIACGFKDEMRFKPAVSEPETRVNISEAQKEAQTQVVRIFNSDSKEG